MTVERPQVDRIACPWLIKRFVDSDAEFLYAPRDQVRAVAENKVYLAPSLPWGWIDAPPSINRLIGLRWLLKTFYPTEAGIDLRTDTRFFYALFYGAKLEDSQLDRLLGGAGAR